jgi:hypothetical protein
MVTKNAGQEKRKHFFVFHRDSSFGINYDGHGTFRNNRRFPVDSILMEVIGSNTFDRLVTQKAADTLSWNTERTELKEVYVHKGTKDTPAVRISFYYSKKLNHLQASLNSTLDSLKNMKFYKFEFVIETHFYPGLDKQMPAMVLKKEMREVTIDDDTELLNYTEKYKNNWLLSGKP